LSQTIKKISGYENVPIIAVTAFAGSDVKKDFLSIGLSHYISKPFMQKELLD
jgi:DNA-binding response OmpR family regulator